MKNYLLTWFYAESKNDDSYYPSVEGSGSSEKVHEYYWKCVYDFYETAKITQDLNTVNLMFFTNVEKLPENIGGINFEKYFIENNIEVIRLELTNKTPKDWYGSWRNQFYLFDVLNYCKAAEGNYLILDSDCFIRYSLNPVFENIERNSVVTYNYGYSLEHDINGISIKQMRNLYEEFFSESASELSYYGGEFIAVNSKIIPEILDIYKKLWDCNFEKYLKKDIKLNEEAHFLSLIYYKLGMRKSDGNQYIKRIWTSVKYDNAIPEDKELAIWHLPAEKKYAFGSVFKWLRKKNRTQSDLIKYLNKVFMINHNCNLRKIKKMYLKLVEKIMK